MGSLLRTPHFEITRDPRSWSVVRIFRTPAPFASELEMDDTFAQVQRTLDNLGRARLCLLVDIREGPLRTDPTFERAFVAHRQRMLGGFARVAVLVRTAIGRLQVQRHAREDRNTLQVFDDEVAAVGYLAQHVSERPARP